MPRIEVDYRDYFRPIADGLQSGGLLLVSNDTAGKPNPITIGWGTLGPIWGRGVFVAMIRPSRHTFGLVETTGDFTVNLLPRGMSRALAFCGTRSGRDVDKFAAVGLTPEPSQHVKSASIAEATLTLECVVVEKADMAPESLSGAITASFYAEGDFHRLYFGEIVAAYADDSLMPG